MATDSQATQDTTKTSKSSVPWPLEILACVKEQKKIGELFPDFRLQVDSTEIPCHRFILSACSGFFRGLLVSGMKEDQQQRVIITGISLEVVNVVLDMIYTGENLLTAENMIDVWHAANQLEILFLLRLCESFITNHINDANCCEIYANGKLLDSKPVTSASWEYILSHFETVRLSHDTLELPLKDVIPLIQSQNLYIKSEDNLIDFIFKWVNYNPSIQNKANPVHNSSDQKDLLKGETDTLSSESSSTKTSMDDIPTCNLNMTNRNKDNSDEGNNAVNHHESDENAVSVTDAPFAEASLGIKTQQWNDRWNSLVDLLAETRLCLLSCNALVQILSHKLILSDDRAMTLVKNTIASSPTTSDAHECYVPLSALYRKTDSNANAIVWTEIVSRNNILSLLSVESMKVVHLGNVLNYTPVGLTVYQNNVYIIDECSWHKFDKINNNFPVEGNFQSRYGHSIVCVKGYLYLVGGKHEVERMNTEWRDSVTIVGSLPILVDFSTSLVLGSNVVVLGCDPRSNMTAVQCFQTQTYASYHIQDIDEPPQNLAVFTKVDKAFLLFGSGNLWTVEVSETNLLSARFVTRLWSFNRSLTGSVLVGDKLFVFDKDSEKEVEPTWALSVSGVFNSIHNTRHETGRFFRAISVPRRVFD